MGKSGKIWVKADRSKNIYQVTPYEYEQILNNKITESYRIDHCSIPALINKDTAKFASKLQIVDRLGKIDEKCPYILFIDNKNNFQDRKQARLINPTKTELDSVYKDLMQKTTSSLLSSPKYNLWNNSLDTIDWFKNINKKKSIFI